MEQMITFSKTVWPDFLLLSKLVRFHPAKVAQDRDKVSNHHGQDGKDDKLDQLLGVGHVEAVDRLVEKDIYAAAGKENRPVLNHFGIGDKKCGASLVGACTKIGTFDMPSMASMRAGRLISARYQALSHR